MIKTTLAKLLTTKLAVAAAATAAVTVGGVAAVAATGHPSVPASESSTHAPATTGAQPHASESSETAKDRPSVSGDDHDPSASPTPSLTGLCHAYEAGAGSEHGKALESPAFKVLITTAGGNDKVDAYCTKVLAEEKADNTPVTTTPSGKDHSSREAHPTPDPNTHASNAPTSHPGR
ncbi:hypothetical protein [Amycolatopsis pigmentata]|uniref:Uncharacterized protein n=1 Tax=Amycolatopsis pigmentata TaxID=450801 RepID=A0ABW5G095_9PSEU